MAKASDYVNLLPHSFVVYAEDRKTVLLDIKPECSTYLHAENKVAHLFERPRVRDHRCDGTRPDAPAWCIPAYLPPEFADATGIPDPAVRDKIVVVNQHVGEHAWDMFMRKGARAVISPANPDEGVRPLRTTAVIRWDHPSWRPAEEEDELNAETQAWLTAAERKTMLPEEEIARTNILERKNQAERKRARKDNVGAMFGMKP